MEYSERNTKITSVGYESLIWVRNKDGREYACSLADINGFNIIDELAEEEKAKCMDVSQIIGTERW